MKHLPSSLEVDAGLRALVRTLAPSKPLTEGAARLVHAIQRYFGTAIDVDTLEPIDDATLAARLRDPWLRQQLVRALVIGLLIDNAGSRCSLARIEAIAAALGVVEPAIVDAAYFLTGKHWRLRRRVLARFWTMEHIKARIAERGFLRAVVPVIWSTIVGRYRNRALAAKFGALRALPHGTLGRGYIEYLETNRFPLPGERGAVSDIILPHDLAHVLGGYSTAPADEVLVASFSAGHRLADPFAMVMFVLFQFHLGLRVTPGAKAERGLFDPASVLDAIVRGSAVTFDLTSVRWDYWMDMPVSLDELRARFNIVPRTTAMPRAA